MDKTILIATKNQKKQRELQDLLNDSNWKIITLSEFPDCPPIIEDGATFRENAQKKAVTVSQFTGLLTIADDSGLEVDALNNAPGIYSARYAKGDESTDEENNKKVLNELNDIPNEQRTARFVCAVAIAKNNQVLFSTQQRVDGIIIREPRGNNGFGYDPIFYYPPFEKTFAEIPAEQKHTVSHRGQALRAAVEFLKMLSDDD